MAFSILNNIPSLAAENQLNITNAAMQKTLAQLSSGSRINNGADDAAGLAIANGLQANVTALTQSAANANDGIGELQLADGALAQVTSLLNRAVTLATEAANGGLGSSQTSALDAEYQNILSEITQIGTSTTYNGQQVFKTASGPDLNEWVSNGGATTALTPDTALTGAGTTVQFTAGGKTFTYDEADGDTVGDLISAINNPATDSAGLQAYIGTSGSQAGELVVVDPSGNNDIATGAANTETVLGTFSNPTVTGSATTDIFLGDSTASGDYTIGVTIGGLTTSFTDANGLHPADLTGTDLTGGTSATQTVLQTINTAIADVASIRGELGAKSNQLTAASNVVNAQVQNLTSAEDTITAADIPTTVANMSKYSILEQTGISALAQANQMQQLVLKLLQ
ncbi:MAG TPA: flagellin [Terriglobales bacterium]|nr:flagellin [Terriglobales bacterium]